ncbi:hypothetical protein [Rosistilla oblonga]|uniref:Uncharacterized protein n=1 Tax=Rosistilla oblonga TaxID=2527990 RepID=A0A518IT73_9BACT|nr:hypothetical protein [Rosistilla oblonga]QDV56263.1 hypothetical protein Mal33_22450 [Rosistilla oblonga]
MKNERCGIKAAKQKSDCHTIRDTQTVQPFPASGSLADNLGVPLPVLKQEIGKDNGRAYSYVLSTVKCDHQSTTFEQHGSAPNFQGGMLTLCTCKHQMRATQSADQWNGVWIAGFTSRTIHDGKHWLFYLAKIDSAHESHADLWQAMKAHTRNAKVADRHFLGDMFRPKLPLPTGKARFLPSCYVTPTAHAHRQHRGDKGWRNDINYRHSDRYSYPPLLAADPNKTFIWDEPMIFFAGDHCRNFHKWSSLSDLVSKLKGVK